MGHLPRSLPSHLRTRATRSNRRPPRAAKCRSSISWSLANRTPDGLRSETGRRRKPFGDRDPSRWRPLVPDPMSQTVTEKKGLRGTASGSPAVSFTRCGSHDTNEYSLKRRSSRPFIGASRGACPVGRFWWSIPSSSLERWWTMLFGTPLFCRKRVLW